MSPLILALLLAAPDSVVAPRWTAGLSYGFEAFTRTQSAWQAASAQLGHRFDHGALIGELLTARRFGLTDAGVAVDAYRTLWHGAYGNLRVQADPGAAVLPRVDAAAEVFQAVRGGWELSGGYRRMQYASDHADLWSAGVAKYAGNWYLRARAIVVPRGGTTAVSGSLAVRRYLATADDWLELQGGLGEEPVTVGGGAVDVRKNRYAAATFHRFLSAHLGYSVGATYNGTDGFPDRRGLTAGLLTRW